MGVVVLDTGQVIGELLIRVAKDNGCEVEDGAAEVTLEPQHRVEYDAGAASSDAAWPAIRLVPRPVLVRTRVEAMVTVHGRTARWSTEVRAGDPGPYDWSGRRTTRTV